MYRSIIETHGKYGGFQVDSMPADPEGKEDAASRLGDDVSCVVVQYPSVFGQIKGCPGCPGFWQILRRGLVKARQEWLWACATQGTSA